MCPPQKKLQLPSKKEPWSWIGPWVRLKSTGCRFFWTKTMSPTWLLECLYPWFWTGLEVLLGSYCARYFVRTKSTTSGDTG